MDSLPLTFSHCLAGAKARPTSSSEALASGRRVVATRVGGIPDVLSSAASGEMGVGALPDELSEALWRVAQASYDPVAVAATGPMDWSESARLLHLALLSARDGSPLPRECGSTSASGQTASLYPRVAFRMKAGQRVGVVLGHRGRSGPGRGDHIDQPPVQRPGLARNEVLSFEQAFNILFFHHSSHPQERGIRHNT